MRTVFLLFQSRGLIAGALLIANASAQTSTWIAPSSTTPQSWSAPGNWDNGVPNSAAATAVFANDRPSASIAVISGMDVAIGDLRLGHASLHIGSSSAGASSRGSLTVFGAGLFSSDISRRSIDLPNGALHFRNEAAFVAGLFAGQDPSYLGGQVSIDFADDSTNRGEITLGGGRSGGKLEFQDHSTLDGGRIAIGSAFGDSSVIFRDAAVVRSGSIAIDSHSQGTIRVEGNADVSGLEIVADGDSSLDLSSAARTVALRSITGKLHVNLGANTLVLGTITNDVHLDGKFSGSGNLSFLRSNGGEIGITNPNNDYTGQTTVGSTVALRFGGRLNNVRVAGGRLIIDSFGTIHGDLDVQGGAVSLVRISKYTSSMHVTGNYSQDSTSSLTLSLPMLLNVSVDGDAVLAGSLQLNTPFTTSVGTQRHRFLVARSVVGRFDSVSGLLNTAMLRSRIDYGPTDAALLIEQQPFAKVDGHTRATAALGAHVDATLPSATGSYYSLLASLNSFVPAADVCAALDAVAPDRYSAMPDQAFADAAARETTLARQFGHGSSLFFEGRHAKRKTKAVDGLERTESSINGGMAGGGWRHGAFTLGAFVAHQNGTLHLDDAGSRVRIRSTTPGVHGRLEAGKFHFDGTASVTRHDYDIRRRIAYSGFDQTAMAAPAAREVDLAFIATRVFRGEDWSLAVDAGFLGSEWKADDFTEINVDAPAIQISGWRNRSLRSRLGCEIAPRESKGSLQPRFAVRWLHEFKPDRPIRSRLASTGGDYYLAPGRRADADEIQFDAGLDWRITRHLVAHANLGVTAGQHRVMASDISVGLRWQW